MVKKVNNDGSRNDNLLNGFKQNNEHQSGTYHFTIHNLHICTL